MFLNASVIKSKLFNGHLREREREQGETLTSIRLLEARPSLPVRRDDASRRACSPIRASRLCISRCPNFHPACKGETNRRPYCDALWSPRRPSVPNEILFVIGRPSCAVKILLRSAGQIAKLHCKKKRINCIILITIDIDYTFVIEQYNEQYHEYYYPGDNPGIDV